MPAPPNIGSTKCRILIYARQECSPHANDEAEGHITVLYRPGIAATTTRPVPAGWPTEMSGTRRVGSPASAVGYTTFMSAGMATMDSPRLIDNCRPSEVKAKISLVRGLVANTVPRRELRLRQGFPNHDGVDQVALHFRRPMESGCRYHHWPDQLVSDSRQSRCCQPVKSLIH